MSLEGQVYIAEWSSSVARRAHNPEVAGSNPVSATKSIPGFDTISNPGIFLYYKESWNYAKKRGRFQLFLLTACSLFGTAADRSDWQWGISIVHKSAVVHTITNNTFEWVIARA